jgi:flagellar protein FlaG
MSDVKLHGVEQSFRSATASSSQKTRENGDLLKKEAVDKAVEEKDEAQEVAGATGNVGQAVTQLNDYVQTVERNLQFNLDDASGKTIITVVDKGTSEVIRQIPDDVALKLAQDLQQNEPLSLFKAKV